MNLHAFSLLLAVIIAQANRQPDRASSLNGMRDRYRPLLLFAPTEDVQLARQVQALTQHRAELIDRQIMLVPFLHRSTGAADAEIMTFLTPEELTIRRHFRVRDEEFTVILLGKDGGEKFRSHTLVTMDQLNRIIDAMPMRQQEMRRPPS